MRIVAIIQARMGSSRFPNKVLKDIEGKPLLWHVINRLKKAQTINEIVVATTIKTDDVPILKLSSETQTKNFAGSENDVLDRFYQVAKKYGAEVIVRITSDCPLIDPKEVDKLVAFYLNNHLDYASNTCPTEDGGCKQTYPDGLDAEVFSFEALKSAWKNAKLVSEREHVTPYIRKNPKLFKVSYLEYPEDLSNMRWTVDYPEDLTFIRAVYRFLYKKGKVFSMTDVLHLLTEHPELKCMNTGLIRNEGYSKSLKLDKKYSNKKIFPNWKS